MPKSVFTDAYRTMLDVLVEARRDAGVSQVELAKRLGKPQPWVSKVENGVRRIDVIEFIAIARAIGEPAGKLFESVNKRMPKPLEV